jgi:hypothetical protein
MRSVIGFSMYITPLFSVRQSAATCNTPVGADQMAADESTGIL